jgi:hypothetical protein
LHVERLVTHAFLIPNFLLEVFPFRGFYHPGEMEMGRIKIHFCLPIRIARSYSGALPITKTLRFAHRFGTTQVIAERSCK